MLFLNFERESSKYLVYWKMRLILFISSHISNHLINDYFASSYKSDFFLLYKNLKNIIFFYFFYSIHFQFLKIVDNEFAMCCFFITSIFLTILTLNISNARGFYKLYYHLGSNLCSINYFKYNSFK